MVERYVEMPPRPAYPGKRQSWVWLKDMSKCFIPASNTATGYSKCFEDSENNRRPAPKKPPIIVSACLLGVGCRYDGESRTDPRALSLFRAGRAIPVCPEQLGGLPTPREPAEIVGGDGGDVLDGRARVIDKAGRDVTASFVRGAKQVLFLARQAGARRAILKRKSPSCGVRSRGQLRSRIKVPGDEINETPPASDLPPEGVTAALLRRAGIRVYGSRT